MVPIGFEEELTALINKHSMENDSNTPDYVLARFMDDCLSAFNLAVRTRARFYDHMDCPGGVDKSNSGIKTGD